MDLNWDEVLQSPELCKLIYENLGVSEEDWDMMVENQDLDDAINAFGEMVYEGDLRFKALCESSGYGATYEIFELGGFYFTNNNGWEGPMPSIDCMFDIAFFFTAKGIEHTTFTIKSSLDDETIFNIIGDCDCPITVNGAKYLHDGKKYVKAK